jgi:hypothetical protein
MRAGTMECTINSHRWLHGVELVRFVARNFSDNSHRPWVILSNVHLASPPPPLNDHVVWSAGPAAGRTPCSVRESNIMFAQFTLCELHTHTLVPVQHEIVRARAKFHPQTMENCCLGLHCACNNLDLAIDGIRNV